MELKYYLRGLGLGIVVTAIIMSLTTSKSRTMTDAEIISRAKQLGMTEERTLKDTAADEENDSDGKTAGEEPSEDGDSDEDASDEGDVSDDESAEDTSGKGFDGSETVGDGASDEDVSDTEDGGIGIANGNADDTAVSGAAQQGDGNRQTVLPDNEETGVGNGSGTETVRADDGEDDDNTVQTAATRTNAPMVVTIGSGDGSYAASRKLADVGAVSSAENFDTFLCQNGYDKKIKPGTYTIPVNASNEQMARIITGAE